ncbi:MAG: HlyD family efflux transporter periplasmic adaptor subunit [Spirochaetales bacterium]|nr:HlyD family efflux transporter periplasmic adaptor subunit [Spirochaetales bacterium]
MRENKIKSEKIIQSISKSMILRETGSPKILSWILIFIFIIFGLFLAWASFVNLEEKIFAPGEILTLEEKISIQHPIGGTVEEIYIKEGDLLQKDQDILKFDKTEMLSRISEIEVKISSLERERNSLQEEFNAKRKLFEEGLLSNTVYYNLQRDLEGLRSEIQSNRIVKQRLVDNLENLTIKSPVEGKVFNIKRISKGNVIRSGETILDIIPSSNSFVVFIKIKPSDIGEIKIGNQVDLKFSAFNYNRFGKVKGVINEISATTFVDESRNPYYRGSIFLEKGYIGEDSTKNKILPGMLVTAEIKIGSKSLLEYLVIPVKSKLDNSLNER